MAGAKGSTHARFSKLKKRNSVFKKGAPTPLRRLNRKAISRYVTKRGRRIKIPVMKVFRKKCGFFFSDTKSTSLGIE
jgi:hypothetical protein